MVVTANASIFSLTNVFFSQFQVNLLSANGKTCIFLGNFYGHAFLSGEIFFELQGMTTIIKTKKNSGGEQVNWIG